MENVSNAKQNNELARLAAQCVMCGLCLPHCPSYRVERNETDSPRGRLALMAALARDALDAQPSASLDRCMSCGSCEPVCPPKVQFIRALTLTRARYAPVHESLPGRIARRLACSPRLNEALSRSAVLVRHFLPRQWRRRLNLDGLARVNHLHSPFQRALPQGGREPPITLLAGCAAGVMERAAIDAIEKIAAVCELPLHVDRSSCCGVLSRHLGKPGMNPAPQAAAKACVAINSGCTARWQSLEASTNTSAIATWLDALLARNATTLATRTLRVVLHVPCSQRVLSGEVAALNRLIARIPGVEIASLPTQPSCCGAAGTYFLNQPAASQRLGQEIAAQIVALGADIVVSANGGCRIQIAQALHDLGSSTRIVHPAEMIAASLVPA